MTPLGRGQPCRYCTRLTWLTGPEGPAHPCCAWWAEREPGTRCRACRASEASRAHRFERTIIDARAIASGKRRASLADYRAAQEQLRKGTP